ncbi:hypothetical protein KZX50_00605 [Bacillus infantis]|uniref:hypothetical protein n=1 Tax=Bacillus infantis TaxID=324767 RepID=UPI002004046E|nr:hypothetical protein [Bacillus infantis]MCK6203948.1 hypothetical protein [Bacillus infantis]
MMANKWTEELIESELRKCIKSLQINRMPSADELKMLGRNDLHCKISRTKKYKGWADTLGIPLKSSETTKGNKYEWFIKKRIEAISDHLNVEKMATKHPYDLLVNDCVKIDVKVAAPHMLRGQSRVHTFGLNKKYATCDIYVCVALDESENVERTFIIPSSHAQIVTLCVGKESKYNKYVDNWDFIRQFVDTYERAINI